MGADRVYAAARARMRSGESIAVCNDNCREPHLLAKALEATDHVIRAANR